MQLGDEVARAVAARLGGSDGHHEGRPGLSVPSEGGRSVGRPLTLGPLEAVDGGRWFPRRAGHYYAPVGIQEDCGAEASARSDERIQERPDLGRAQIGRDLLGGRCEDDLGRCEARAERPGEVLGGLALRVDAVLAELPGPVPDRRGR